MLTRRCRRRRLRSQIGSVRSTRWLARTGRWRFLTSTARCAFYYNEKVLKQLGVEVPKTYDEVVTVAGKAAKAGVTGFGTGFSDADNSAIIATFFDCFMSQVDQPIWNAER